MRELYRLQPTAPEPSPRAREQSSSRAILQAVMGRLDTLESSLRQAHVTGPAVSAVTDISKEMCKDGADAAAEQPQIKRADDEIVDSSGGGGSSGGSGGGSESDRMKRRLLKQVFISVELQKNYGSSSVFDLFHVG